MSKYSRMIQIAYIYTRALRLRCHKRETKMSGKVAIVTGGNKGIGYAIVKGLVENGKFEHVYLTARVF